MRDTDNITRNINLKILNGADNRKSSREANINIPNPN